MNPPPIPPGTAELAGITLGEPARLNNGWVWDDYRFPTGRVFVADPVEPIPTTNQPDTPPGGAPEGDPGGSPT